MLNKVGVLKNVSMIMNDELRKWYEAVVANYQDFPRRTEKNNKNLSDRLCPRHDSTSYVSAVICCKVFIHNELRNGGRALSWPVLRCLQRMTANENRRSRGETKERK
jgi:hypothetical protein